MSSAPAVTQAVRVLKELARHASPQPAASLARNLELPRSSVYRVLHALEESGFATHFSESHRWGLGPSAYELGSAYTRQAPLQRMARSMMTQLAETTQETSHLAILDGRDVLYLIEERPLGRQPLVSDVGVRLPASLTASGLAMLAALPAAQLRALYPQSDFLHVRTGEGPTTLVELRDVLARTRQRGYAVEEGSVTPGFASVAVAVTDRHGFPVASVASTWNSHTASAGILDKALEACHLTATKLQQRLTS